MAISNSIGLGGILGSGSIAAAQSSGFITTTTNTSGQYQNPAMWDQDRAYRDEMIRREERARLEQRYRDEIHKYGYLGAQEAMKQEAPEQKRKAVPANSFPEGYEKNLLLLLEH